MYVIGGEDAQNKSTNSVQGYRFRLKQTFENCLEQLQVPPMLDCRCDHGVAQCESGIVVCGGWNDDAELNTCEIYDKSAKV